MNNVGFLNVLRKRQRLKFKDIAARTGLSIGYLGMIFTGKFTVVPDTTKKKIARALGVRSEIIFQDEKR